MADIKNWISGQWSQIRGNLKYDLFVRLPGAALLSAVIAWLLREIQKARGIAPQDRLGYVILGLLIFCALILVWIAARQEIRIRSGTTAFTAEPPTSQRRPLRSLTAPPTVLSQPRPVDLQGEILEIYFFDTTPLPITRKYVLVKAQIVNRGHDEATITHCILRVKVGNFQRDGTVTDIPALWRIKKQRTGVLFGLVYDEEVITPRLGANRNEEIYKKGHPREGWINFEFYIENTEFPNAEFTIFLKDSLGGEHRVVRPPRIYEKTGEIVIVSKPDAIQTKGTT